MVTRFYGIKTGVRKVSVPNIIGINKTQARINLSNISLTYLEQTTPGTVLSDNDIVSAQGTASGSVIPRGSVVQYTYKVFTFTPPYFPPFFPPFFPPHFPPFFPPFFPPHFPAAETWGPCTSYQVIQPTCNGEDVYQGYYQGTRRTSSLGNVEVCSGLVFTGFGSCIASNNRSCGGAGPDGPC